MRIQIIIDIVQLGRAIWEKREIQNVNTVFIKTQCTLSFAIYPFLLTRKSIYFGNTGYRKTNITTIHLLSYNNISVDHNSYHS